METRPFLRGLPGYAGDPATQNYLSKMRPSRDSSSRDSSWQNNMPRPGGADGIMSPLLPENAWLLDEYRRQFPNVPEDILMEILRKKFANEGPQIKNPSMVAPTPTLPRVGNRIPPMGGGTHDPQDPLGLQLQLKGLRF